jgi:hypothetical protein
MIAVRFASPEFLGLVPVGEHLPVDRQQGNETNIPVELQQEPDGR